MKGVRSVFTTEELDFMENTVGLKLSDEKDYTTDELLEVYDQITELPYEYDDEGYPLEAGRLFESIMDKYLQHFDN